MLAKSALCLLVLALLSPYVISPIYRFPPAHSFSGPDLFNPYSRTGVVWRKANLHSHGLGWGTPVDGRQSDDLVVDAYRRRGYAVAAVADHQRISDSQLPVYEHGYGVGKQHQLAIGARSVDWFDLPLAQFRSQKQYVIDRLSDGAALVAIAHPTERHAYSAADFAELTGFQLMEVVNGRSTAGALWDAALASGHCVWGIASDDTHDITDARRTGVAWTMIDSDSADFDDVVSALREGRMYSVSSRQGRPAPRFKSLTVERDTIRVAVEEGETVQISFIGQGGRALKTVPHVTEAAYSFTADDSYVRTVIGFPDGAIYLNPVVRSAGMSPPPDAMAVIDPKATWLVRGGAGLAYGVLLLFLFARSGTKAATAARAPRKSRSVSRI